MLLSDYQENKINKINKFVSTDESNNASKAISFISLKIGPEKIEQCLGDLDEVENIGGNYRSTFLGQLSFDEILVIDSLNEKHKKEH